MKRILAAAVLAVGIAHAGVVATMKNNGGGQIVLTDIACSTIEGAKVAYATGTNINTITGCWTFDEKFVHILWDDGNQLRSYELHDWQLVNNKRGGNI